MGTIRIPEPATLIVGFITNDLFLVDTVIARLEEYYGPIDFRSQIINFNFTEYYTKELGKDLKRQFVSFQNVISPHTLSDIKLLTNTIEQEYLHENRRCINIDPGYIQLGKLILATTKDQQHRIFIGQGIYAEITLRFHEGTFTIWEWTYRDYRTPEYIAIFNHIRTLHQKKLSAC